MRSVVARRKRLPCSFHTRVLDDDDAAGTEAGGVELGGQRFDGAPADDDGIRAGRGGHSDAGRLHGRMVG